MSASTVKVVKPDAGLTQPKNSVIRDDKLTIKSKKF